MSSINNYNCDHSWLKVHEQSLIGTSFPVGWQCEKCNVFIPIGEVTPTGLSGVTTKKHKLIGIHGGKLVTLSGKHCSYQIYDEKTKNLTYHD